MLITWTTVIRALKITINIELALIYYQCRPNLDQLAPIIVVPVIPMNPLIQPPRNPLIAL